jgi:hypothetical protein
MRLKAKIPTFIFGVSIGLLVGVAFFVFNLTEMFNRLKASATSQVTVIQQPVKQVTVSAQPVEKNRERFKINLGKTAKVNYREVDSLIGDDSKITIATEELLSVKNVKLIHLDDKNSAGDSLSAKLANVSEPVSDTYQIEFWKTPLNSKGYRFSKNKIVLYGVQDFSSVLLYELDKNYYIKFAGQVYQVTYSSEFKPLTRVVDPELLTRIS